MKKVLNKAMNKNVAVKESYEKDKAILLLSFLLPIIMMVAIIISKRVFPFGDRCILRTDFYHQYLPFYTELQHKLKNLESFFYTYKVGLGTNFVPLFAYYLSCPLNLLLILISDKYVIEFMTVMIILKIALSSLCMSYYLMKRYKTNSFAVVFCAIFYGMGGYMGAYYWNIMWLNNIVLFPLLMLGFENINNGKKPYIYILTLALSIIFNYYIGTITCFFLIIYFIFYNVLKEKKIKEVLTNFVKIGIYSIIGVMISSFLLIPVFKAFGTTASSGINFPTTPKEYFSIVEVIGRHLPFVKVENGIEYWPNIYSGIICLPLFVLYILSKKYKTREKICYSVLLLFFIASFSINILDFVFHVFKYPNSLPCRHGFIYTFILLNVCFKPLLKLNSIKTNEISIAFIIPVLLLIFFEKTILNDKVLFYSVYFSLIFLLIYYIVFIKYQSNKSDKNLLLYVIFVIVCFEAFINMHQTSISTIKREDYMKNVDSIRKITKEVKYITNDFYRIERDEMKTKDDGAFLHFPSASIFSSSAYKSGSDFYKSFGMEASTNAYSTTGSTPFATALLGIKYKICEKPNDHVKDLNMREIFKVDNVILYQNLNTLPLSFMLTNSFLKDYDKSSGNPATVQNNFSRTLKLGTMLDKQNIDINGKEAKITLGSDGDYYAFIRDKSIKEVVVTYPTTNKTFKNLNRGYLIELGFLKANEEISFRNNTNDDELLIEVFKFNYETLKKVVGEINSNSTFEMNNFTSSKINYQIDVARDGVCVVTLPFDKGFTVYVDDKKVDTKETLDLFLSFDLSRGKHNVRISFIPQGIILGFILSLIGISLFAALYILDKKKIINL